MGIGFVTGNLYLNEYFYTTYNEIDIYNVEEIKFVKNEKSVITNSDLFDPHGFHDYLKHFNKLNLVSKTDFYITASEFSKLVQVLKRNEIYFRTVKLIIESNQSKNFLLKAGILSIALETISNMIYEENDEKIRVVEDKKLAQEIRNRLKSVLKNEFKVNISEEAYAILESKIGDLNNPTNSKKLIFPFEYFQILLINDDKEILGFRNKFLHGISPFDGLDKNSNRDIVYVVLRLKFLICFLLLKYSGYKGHMNNFAGRYEFNTGKKVTDHLYRIIR
jgi:hypothetical protein